MHSPRWTIARVIAATLAFALVTLAIAAGTWSMLHGRPGPALLFAVAVLSGTGAARLLLFD